MFVRLSATALKYTQREISGDFSWSLRNSGRRALTPLSGGLGEVYDDYLWCTWGVGWSSCVSGGLGAPMVPGSWFAHRTSLTGLLAMLAPSSARRDDSLHCSPPLKDPAARAGKAIGRPGAIFYASRSFRPPFWNLSGPAPLLTYSYLCAVPPLSLPIVPQI